MERNTAQQILDVAQDMVRNRGYSAFSYADISKQVGIRKASIHYHFPTKDALVQALVQRYRETMEKACDRIARSSDSPDQKLIQFANLYRDSLDNDQICLCSMLTADFAVLPPQIQAELQAFFIGVEAWLTILLKQGCESNLWTCQPSAEQDAKGIIAMLQGAQLLARFSEDRAQAFERAVYPLLSSKIKAS